MHIVLKWISLPSSPPCAALRPDSCWIQHSRAFTGTACHSSARTRTHTHPLLVYEYQHVHAREEALVHSHVVSRALLSDSSPSLTLSPFPSLSHPLFLSPWLSPSLSICPYFYLIPLSISPLLSLAFSSTLFIHLSPFISPSFSLPTLVSGSLALSICISISLSRSLPLVSPGTADYLAFVQKVIKQNDQLHQLSLSALVLFPPLHPHLHSLCLILALSLSP